MRNTGYVQENELAECIAADLPRLINLYLKQQPYPKIIPPNFWYPEYEKTQPGFEKIKEKIMDAAAEKGFDVKKLQNFVIE
jgi:hypothetical protein